MLQVGPIIVKLAKKGSISPHMQFIVTLAEHWRQVEKQSLYFKVLRSELKQALVLGLVI